MAKEKELHKFYNSKRWRKVSKAYYNKRLGICEQCEKGCLEGEYQVHHIIELNLENYLENNIAFDEKNLKLLCNICHNEAHNRFKKAKKNIFFDKNGEVIFK